MDYQLKYLSQLLDTEITCKEDIKKYGIQPDYVFKNIRELYTSLSKKE